MLKVLAAEELGRSAEGAGNPVQAAVAAGISTFLGAMIPVIPFFWLRGSVGVLVAAAVSLVAHFLVGAAKSLFTLRSWWAAGLEMTLAGVIVGGVTYVGGLLFQGHLAHQRGRTLLRRKAGVEPCRFLGLLRDCH